MELDEARSVLGVAPADGWDVVRAAYRRLMREVHPDRAGAGRTRQAARINEAYVVLTRARRAGDQPARRPVPPPPAPAPQPAPSSRPRPREGYVTVGPQQDGMDVVAMDVPPAEAFARLVAAGHRIGEVSYVDRSSGIFEIVLRHGGEVCSLLVMVESRPRGTEVLFALESLERAASPSPAPVVRDLLEALGGGG